jgi:hypothetical protein
MLYPKYEYFSEPERPSNIIKHEMEQSLARRALGLPSSPKSFAKIGFLSIFRKRKIFALRNRHFLSISLSDENFEFYSTFLGASQWSFLTRIKMLQKFSLRNSQTRIFTKLLLPILAGGLNSRALENSAPRGQGRA